MNRTIKNIIITLFCFLVYYIAFENFARIMQLIDKFFNYRLLSYFITYIIIGVPIFTGTCVINNNYKVFNNLGLSKNILQGLIFATIFTIPMFIGGFIFYKFNTLVSTKFFV